MKDVGLLIGALMLVAGTAVAQAAPPASPPTVVTGHAIGESVADFFVKAGAPDLVQNCRSVGNNRKAAKKLKLDLKLCRGAIQADSGGRIATTDPNFPGMHDAELGYGQAILDNGKLVSVNLEFAKGLADVLPDLVQKYGKPLKVESETKENGFGAQFELGKALWNMPDGTTIFAAESIEFDQYFGRGYYRTTTVHFSSREENARLAGAMKNHSNAFN